MDHDHDGRPPSFDERAATWDDEAKIERARWTARRIAEEVDLTGDERLLEYGAGTGLVSEALRDLVGPITLADPSEGMRAQIQTKVDDGRLPGARVRDLDLSRDQLPDDEQFDLIVTSMVLHHVDPVDPVLAAFRSMTADGGHLCVIDLDAEDGSFHGQGVDVHHGFDRDDLAGRLSAAGYAAVSVTDCGSVERDEGGTYGLFLAVASR